MKKLTIAAIQLPTLGMQATKLDFYLKNAHKRGVKVVLFGEYVLNHFFKELSEMPIKMVEEQSQKRIELLKKCSLKYDMILIAPIVIIKEERYIKSIAKITPKSINFYEQQILIPYKHWNEKKFFSNPIKPIEIPMLFQVDGFRIMMMGGFELHFDPFWQSVTDKKIDLVLLPTASTFGSHNRWREIIKTKAFLHGCYILRANRLGEFNDNSVKWKFYGDSMLVEPSGEVYMMLEDKESMLIETISKNAINEHRKAWGFEKELKLRENL
ncbi:Predicted amidohydrolase [hydrothermal vent metagenome]|uniref:Predicted amidohydrolase n=1 Tax=hydrothermal vent metagenome TaxID=652676 RepID=A0A1W1CPW6_9ZZZZ